MSRIDRIFIVCFMLTTSIFTSAYAVEDNSKQKVPQKLVKVQNTQKPSQIQFEAHTDISNFKNKISQLSNSQSRYEQDIILLSSKVDSLRYELEGNLLKWKRMSTLSRWGSIFLLCGLLIEIIGAILLSSKYLIVPQNHVFSLKPTPSLRDLATYDLNQESLMNFFGLLGVICLFAGFILQCTGTIIIFDPYWWIVVLSISSIFLVGIGFLYFLDKSLNQTLRINLRTFFINFRRNIIAPLILNKGHIACDICSRAVDVKSGEVWWLQEPNSTNHPFLNPPYNWHLGHRRCLEEFDLYSENRSNSNHSLRNNVHRASFNQFINKTAPDLQKWWKQYNEHLSKLKRKAIFDTSPEEEFKNILERIKRIYR